MNPSAILDWQLPGGYGLEIPGVDFSGLSLQSLYLFQALDRPDRCQVRVGIAHGSVSTQLPEDLRINLRSHGRLCFTGLVSASHVGFNGREGGWMELTAYADFHHRRSLATRWYYQLTDSELARRLAVELGLVPVVEPTQELHARVRVAGDALSLLRRRAKRYRYCMGVTAGKLFFCKSWPLSGPPLEVERGRDVVDLEWRRRSAGARRVGVLTVAGGGEWHPLASFRIRGLAAGLPSRGYVTRALHFLDTDGHRTRILFRTPEQSEVEVVSQTVEEVS